MYTECDIACCVAFNRCSLHQHRFQHTMEFHVCTVWNSHTRAHTHIHTTDTAAQVNLHWLHIRWTWIECDPRKRPRWTNEILMRWERNEGVYRMRDTVLCKKCAAQKACSAFKSIKCREMVAFMSFDEFLDASVELYVRFRSIFSMIEAFADLFESAVVLLQRE